MSDGPRVAPGTRDQIGVVNVAITRALGLATGGAPPNLFTTLARHRGLFRKWLRFAGALMPGGRLPRADSELWILRVAHNTGCEYEWRHHERIAQHSGLTAEEVERVRVGAGAEGWAPRRALLLRAADELHSRRRISDELWTELGRMLSEPELIELCTEAAARWPLGGHGRKKVARVEPAIDAIERGIRRRSRRIACSEHAPLTTPEADGSRNSPR